MRVLDMRLIAFVTLIVLTAAMPANCAEEPIVPAPILRDFNNEAPAPGAVDQALGDGHRALAAAAH